MGVRGRSGGDEEPEWESYLEPVVLTAALLSVPAVFLATLDGLLGAVGFVANWVSMIVLTGETVLLFWTSGDRLGWLRQHWWLALVAVATVPAVIFAVGPVQILRLVRLVAAFQVIRAVRLVRVAHTLRKRLHLDGVLGYVVWSAALLLAVVFVAIVLADSTSTSRRLLSTAVDSLGWGAVIGLGALAVAVVAAAWLSAGALWRVVRARFGRGISSRER